MNTTDSKRNGRNFFSFLRRSEKWVELNGYRVGDIPLDEPVFVAPGANIVGNIIAPKIRVAGLVYGSTVALETHIHPDGQIWGDVYTQRLQIESNGKIQGWVSSIDQSHYQAIRSEGVVPEIEQNPGPFTMPTNGRPFERSNNQLDLLRRLQEETATAMAARNELEQSFNKRLQEVAGETSTKIATLTEKLDNAREEITQLHTVQAKQEEDLRERATQVNRQNDELNVGRQLLAERNQELETRQRQYAHLLDAKQAIDAAKAKLEAQLLEARTENDKLTGRLTSVETALQANLQHSAEQEDALLRWQELAEATQKRARELEEALKQVNREAEESIRVREMMQAQRRQLEDELEAVMEQLEAIQHQETQPLSTGKTQQLLTRITELETAQQAVEEQLAQANNTLELETLFAEQAEELSQLKLQYAEIEDEAEDRLAQILWYKANLETTRLEYDALRQQYAAQEIKLTELTTQLETDQAVGKQWQQTAAQSDLKLQQQNKELRTVQQTIMARQQQWKSEKQQMREEIRLLQMQADAHETELARYIEETRAQGRRLAEIQATLVERDITLQEVKEAYSKQANTLQQFKQAAGAHIKSLQMDLTQTKKQLSDAQAVLERRQKRQ